MSKLLKIFVFFVLAIMFYSLSHCSTIDINSLVDDFQKATDIQKTKIVSDNIGKELSAGGIVSNAGEYDFFNTVDDARGTYYQVVTEQQKTGSDAPYQVIFLFKDIDKVSGINKGQAFQGSGKIVKINDERLQTTVWIFSNDLTDKDKALLR